MSASEAEVAVAATSPPIEEEETQANSNIDDDDAAGQQQQKGKITQPKFRCTISFNGRSFHVQLQMTSPTLLLRQQQQQSARSQS